MKELATKYDPSQVEGKWYEYWIKHRLFHSEPDEREAFTIVIPPPNVTGVLHMGHMLNNTIQDILVRRARMEGKNAVWVPGTDHASISTETKVVAKLAAEGIQKRDIGREKFLEHAWEWTDKYGGIILKQLRRLGASCDWERTAFTMDETRSRSVTKVFCDLYDKGLIYRGLRMVNWDPQNRTALSNDEVYFKEENSKLYYLRYYVQEQDLGAVPEGSVVHTDAQGRHYAVVATTRPETIMGDTARCTGSGRLLLVSALMRLLFFARASMAGAEAMMSPVARNCRRSTFTGSWRSAAESQSDIASEPPEAPAFIVEAEAAEGFTGCISGNESFLCL